jgi:hypothetical protein
MFGVVADDCVAEGESERKIDEGSSMNDKKCTKKFEDEGLDNTNNCIEEVLKIHRNKQRILLEANVDKDERLERLEKEYHNFNIQHKEGIYWLRLQLDTSRREKNAAEERIFELQADLQHLNNDESNCSTEDGIINNNNNDNDIRLQKRLKKYETSFGVMENQIAMIKTSSGEVVKTLKEEIADLMEDRSKAELDLLNQLSVLDNESRRQKLDYELQLQNKDEIIEGLRRKVESSTNSDISSFDKDKESSQSPPLKKKEDIIQRLEKEKTELQKKLERATNDLDAFRLGQNTQNTIDLSLGRVETILESVDGSVLKLKDIIDQIVNRDDTNNIIKEDKEKMLSILELISLIHEEAKVSMMLIELKLKNQLEIELKLKNQLQCLKDDTPMTTTIKIEMNDNRDMLNDVREIQKTALAEMRDVETGISCQIKDVEEIAQLEKTELNKLLRERTEKLAEVERKGIALQNQILKLNSTNCDSDQCDNRSSSSCQADHRTSEEKIKIVTDNTITISRNVLDQLQTELVRFVETMHVKNNTIVLLREELDIQNAREEESQKELGTALKRASDLADIGKKIKTNMPTIGINGIKELQKELMTALERASDIADIRNKIKTNRPTIGINDIKRDERTKPVHGPMDKLALHSSQKTPVKVKAVKINKENDVANDWSPQQWLSPQTTTPKTSLKGEIARGRNIMPGKSHEYPVTPPALKVQSENGGAVIGSGVKTNAFSSPSSNNEYIATPIQTPTSIRRLKPSPREIKKPRFSPPFIAREG